VFFFFFVFFFVFFIFLFTPFFITSFFLLLPSSFSASPFWYYVLPLLGSHSLVIFGNWVANMLWKGQASAQITGENFHSRGPVGRTLIASFLE
jgi:hypothetical protein